MLNKKIYFASDFHLGTDGSSETSRQRELKIIRWLEMIKPTCSELFILGDLFDFWFEYKEVVPKGHVRILASLATFVECGIPVNVFSGNHDMWMFDYLSNEIGVNVHHEEQIITLQGKTFQLAHGDGLGPGDLGYKFIKKIFRNKFNQWLFARIHPNLGIKMMKFFSQKKNALKEKRTVYHGADKEWLILHCEETIKLQAIDYFIFGHRHLPIDYTLSNGKSRYINLGDMIHYNTFAHLENGNLILESFENDEVQIFGS